MGMSTGVMLQSQLLGAEYVEDLRECGVFLREVKFFLPPSLSSSSPPISIPPCLGCFLFLHILCNKKLGLLGMFRSKCSIQMLAFILYFIFSYVRVCV